jgi:hypothetical protein
VFRHPTYYSILNSQLRCETNNCLSTLVCGGRADAARHFPAWVYVVVGIGIIGGMFGTLFGLFTVHRRYRDAEREKRIQYWREQVSLFRSNLFLDVSLTRHARINSVKTSCRCVILRVHLFFLCR